ncbi:xanthine dehydrogenase family protein molybdopterin-binding subunit [Herbiconiux solani]|uniref:xanthine dehydrogenase family protein molybdopterin-binding subunit n=1 Tax=Herbiconiux solani TaxID=661329 RepID=UPI000824F677|nr:xanthine dehydrogenase family protein molybdopterin-binding subunit [Herbiconiux solani]
MSIQELAGTPGALGEPLPRLEGHAKVTGAARYAAEHTPSGTLYGWPVQATVGRGRIRSIDVEAAEAFPGVRLVITSANALRLADAGDGELLVLQSDRVAYRRQVVALVVAETAEEAREAAAALVVRYADEAPDSLLSTTQPALYAPEKVNAGFATDSEQGYVDAALATAAHTVDVEYATPALFNNPMEPHATVARLVGDRLEVIDSSQGTSAVKASLATLFDRDPESIRVRAEHVGGGFGSKGSPRPCVVLATMAALMLPGTPVKVVYTRQMMFALAGYRTPTISRFRLGAGTDGRLTAISHQAYSQTSTVQEFAEQTAEVTRHVYAAPNRLTTHRVAALDVPTPRWMRAPGECPGMYALESAMDELAEATGIDPVELRILNEPSVDPESGLEFSSRHLVECLRRGAELFGWPERRRGGRPTDGAQGRGRFLTGAGVASSIYPAMTQVSGATVTALPEGRYEVGVNATDIGTGARTVLLQIAADALGVPAETVVIRIADSDLPKASVAGGSSGTASWGWAVTKACTRLRAQLDQGAPLPPEGLSVTVDTTEEVGAMAERARFAFGAQFAEVRVDLDSGEIAVTRMTGVFAAGRILNPRTARSQFLGAMTMGISMALHENGELDARFGDYANHDLAGYHVAVSADVPAIEVVWLPEHDDALAPMGGKGIGEIGIVGAAAAVGNAVHDATGIRVRSLPIQPDSLLGELAQRGR